jgi:hypothetical protein
MFFFSMILTNSAPTCQHEIQSLGSPGSLSLIVIPANAGIQLLFYLVMAGLDPAISSGALEEITGSSPVMTNNHQAGAQTLLGVLALAQL